MHLQCSVISSDRRSHAADEEEDWGGLRGGGVYPMYVLLVCRYVVLLLRARNLTPHDM